MPFRRLRQFCSLFGLLSLPWLLIAQDAKPASDPRIAHLLTALGEVRGISQTALSPDGRSIAWVVNGEHGGTEVEMAPLSDPTAARRATACAKDTVSREDGIAWSPDSSQLAFFSDCGADHKIAIYLQPSSGSQAHKLAALNGFAKSLTWVPDGKHLSFLYVEGATRPSGALAAMKPPAGVIGVEGLEVQRVAEVDASTGELRQVTPAGLHVYEFHWAADSGKLAYVAAPPPGENNWWIAKLYTQEANAAQPKIFF